MILKSPRETAWAFAGWIISGAVGLAQLSSVEVRSPSAKLLETAPGRIVTASVVVANRGGEDDEIIERFPLIPPGCQIVAPPDLPFRLEAGGQSVRVLAVLVPANMPAGRFDLRYAAHSRRDPSSSGTIDLAIQVTPVDDLELTVEPHPNVVLAGDVYPVKLHVTNRGNSRLAVELAQRSSLGFLMETDAASFALEAGASRAAVCRVKTDKAFARHAYHAVTFDVAATSTAGQTLTASQASVVEIIPMVSGSRDPFHYLPMQLRLMTLAERGHPAQFQAELSGNGSLDEDGKQRVDFLSRGPDFQNASVFGERDEYGASFHGEHLDIDLGDRIFALSPLTERRSPGRGAGVAWRAEATAAGVFSMTTRHRRVNTKELGAFLRQDLTPAISLQGNFLRKTGGDPLASNAPRQNIITLEARYRCEKRCDLRLEAGVSRSDEGVMDHAYRAEARGELPGKITYAIEHVHSGPNFHGYYSGTDTSVATVAKAITPKFRVHASLNRYAGDLAQNDVRTSVVNRENSWNTGANYELSRRTSLSLEWQHVKRADILQPAAYDFKSDALRAGVGHDFGKLMVQSFLDFGTLDNSLTGKSGAFQRSSVTAQWRPSARQTYAVFASNGPSSFTASTEQALGAGASARWQVRENLDANVSYARNQFDGRTGSQQDQALASLHYRLDNGSSLFVTGRWSRAVTRTADAASTNEATLFVAYSRPLDLPVSRKRSIGALEGRVYDESNGRAAGLARVVLRIGEHFAVTDAAGIFEFPALKPGACELKVVVDSLGSRFTMATPLPKKLRILPAATTHVELAATSACSLAVHVVRHEFAGGNALHTNGALREAGGLEAAVVEIGNGRDIWRAQTDRTGRAEFHRLTAGRWTVRVAARDLPSLHYLENPERVVNLKPGGSDNLAVRLLPQKRTLQILDHGSIR